MQFVLNDHGQKTHSLLNPRLAAAVGALIAIALWLPCRRHAQLRARREKQISTGDRTILGKISRRGNRYLRVLFVQAAWVVLIKPKIWERHGLKPWIEAAKKRLHHNVLAIALANKLARIAWSVLARGRAFEARKMDQAANQSA